ncbi:PWI domain protein (macronuclear) [Tetrahymena thermophila SB210]|uniref:PWI domain protein n=1 Tax=Tetrahymena thermophila (strain SB210) TaxID=312017 RepID=Q22MV0_TETTS|nr:PWI domain protein [Tetrahymena thermophila SB210]EAR86681.2 PWI domain protein [Tetrahymena thermophila SB210]|eukprot:XP_976920.2 PWI domain protein [Tetrahymena thermophila SB210]
MFIEEQLVKKDQIQAQSSIAQVESDLTTNPCSQNQLINVKISQEEQIASNQISQITNSLCKNIFNEQDITNQIYSLQQNANIKQEVLNILSNIKLEKNTSELALLPYKQIGSETEKIFNDECKNSSHQSLNEGDQTLKLNKDKKIWNLKTPYKRFGEYKYNKVFLFQSLNDPKDEVYMCQGELQVDVQVLKKCGDNMEYSNPYLSQPRPTTISPFTFYRTPVRVVKYKTLNYTELVLDQNKKVLTDFDSLFQSLGSIQSVLSYSYIQAIAEHLKVMNQDEQLKLKELNVLFSSNQKFKQKLQKLEDKLKQKQNKSFSRENPMFEMDDEDSETNIEQNLEKSFKGCKNTIEQNQYQIFIQTLRLHKEESINQKKIILSQIFKDQCFIYVQKDNARMNLKERTTYYGISNEFEKILFGKYDFSHYSIHSGLFHPYHDYYSHLQHFLVHLLNYQDRRVNLRTFDNYVIQGYLRRHVFTINTTQIPYTNLQFTDTIVLHQFIIDQSHLIQLNEKRKLNKQNIDLDINQNDKNYFESAKFFISKYYGQQKLKKVISQNKKEQDDDQLRRHQAKYKKINQNNFQQTYINQNKSESITKFNSNNSFLQSKNNQQQDHLQYNNNKKEIEEDELQQQTNDESKIVQFQIFEAKNQQESNLNSIYIQCQKIYNQQQQLEQNNLKQEPRDLNYEINLKQINLEKDIKVKIEEQQTQKIPLQLSQTGHKN